MKKKIIIYGLGIAYKKLSKILESEFEIVGCCDKNPEQKIEGYTFYTVSELSHALYDYIFITSQKYFEEIKEELLRAYKIEPQKIISRTDVWGGQQNGQVRNAWVIEKLLNISNGKVILDAGAGEQRYKSYCTHLKYIAQDFGEYVPNAIVTGLQEEKWDYSGLDLKCDVIDIPLEDNSIDVVLCTEVFEHIKNPILALKEFERILRPGGTLLLTAPVCSLTHMAPFYYYNGFSEYWYKEHLKDFHFEIVELTRYGKYFDYIIQELFRLCEISERYAKHEFKPDEAELINNMIKLLARMSERDVGSDELLCFGYMVEAKKLV